MTKQHFVEIAAMLKSIRPANDDRYVVRLQWAEAVSGFCRVAAQWNPRFDVEQFKKACGAQGIGIGI